jgi:phage terminase large subunit GpA-like protein
MQHFPKDAARGYDVEYFRQLTAEKLVQKFQGGKKTFKFIKPDGRRNEALDIRCYATAALSLLNPDFAAIGAKIKAQLEEESEPDHPPEDTSPNQPEAEEPAFNTYEIPSDKPDQPQPVRKNIKIPRRNFATSW